MIFQIPENYSSKDTSLIKYFEYFMMYFFYQQTLRMGNKK